MLPRADWTPSSGAAAAGSFKWILPAPSRTLGSTASLSSHADVPAHGLPPPHRIGGGWRCAVQDCANTDLFGSKFNTIRHMAIHDATVLLLCPNPRCPRGQVGKGFRRKDLLDRHIQKVHEPVSGPRFACQVPGCDKTYKNLVNLESHVKHGVHTNVQNSGGQESDQEMGLLDEAMANDRNTTTLELPPPRDVDGGWQCAVEGCLNTHIYNRPFFVQQHMQVEHQPPELSGMPPPTQVKERWRCAIADCPSTQLYTLKGTAKRHMVREHDPNPPFAHNTAAMSGAASGETTTTTSSKITSK